MSQNFNISLKSCGLGINVLMWLNNIAINSRQENTDGFNLTGCQPVKFHQNNALCLGMNTLLLRRPTSNIECDEANNQELASGKFCAP